MMVAVFLISLLLTMSLASTPFGINSIVVHLSSLPLTNNVHVDNSLVDDPSLDVNDSEYTSPSDQFLFDAAVATPCSVGHVKVLQHIFNTDGKLHKYTVNAVRHHDYDGPRAHLDDGVQGKKTIHKKSHLFVYRTFSVDAPCHACLISADDHRFVPIGEVI